MSHVQAVFIGVFLAGLLIATGAQAQDTPETPAKVIFVGDLNPKYAKEADGGKSSRVSFRLSSPAKIGNFSTLTPVWVQFGKKLDQVKALVEEAKKKAPTPQFLAEGTFAFDGESAVLTGTLKPLEGEEQAKWRGGPSVVVEGEIIHQKYDITDIWKYEMAVKNGKHPIMIGGDLVAKHAKTTGKIRVFGGATVIVEKSGTRYLAVYAEKIETVTKAQNSPE